MPFKGERPDLVSALPQSGRRLMLVLVRVGELLVVICVTNRIKHRAVNSLSLSLVQKTPVTSALSVNGERSYKRNHWPGFCSIIAQKQRGYLRQSGLREFGGFGVTQGFGPLFHQMKLMGNEESEEQYGESCAFHEYSSCGCS